MPLGREANRGRMRRFRRNTAVTFENALADRCGIPREQAKGLATELAHPSQRCHYCGIRQALIYRLNSEGHNLPGGHRMWRRLQIEHLRPLVRDQFITLACYFCNNKKNNGRFKTDEQVRMEARRFWEVVLGKITIKWIS